MLDVLYSMVGFIIAAGYLPQIIKLIRSAHSCHDVSVISWIIWAYTSSITLLYVIYRLETPDIMLICINTINMICISAIVCVTFYKRWKYRAPLPPPVKSVEPIDNMQTDGEYPTEYTIDYNIDKSPLS